MTQAPTARRVRSWFHSIAGRLTLWFLLIALIPSVVLVAVQFAMARRGIEQQVRQNLHQLLNNRIHQLEWYAQQRLREVDVLSKTPEVLRALEEFGEVAGDRAAVAVRDALTARYQPVFEAFVASLDYPNMMLLSSEGKILFRLKPGFEVGQSIKEAPIQGTALGAALERSLAAPPPTISSPETYPAISGDQPLIFTTQTVFEDREIKGIVVFQLNPAELTRIFEDYEGLGQTGEAFVGRRIGREAVILSPLRNDPRGEARHARYPIGGPRAIPLQSAVQEQSGQGESTDYFGVRVISAWGYAPALGVGVVAKVNRDEAFRTVDLLAWICVGLLAVTLVAVVPTAFWSARSFSRPLQEAVTLARSVADGDLLASRAQGRRQTGEIGQLLISIDEMTGQLRTLIKHIQESIVTVMSTSAEIAAVARQQEATVQEHSSATVEVAAAVNEISATSHELARTIGDVQAAAMAAGEMASAGQEALTGMHNAMATLAESTGSIGGRLSVISERAGNINLAVTTITKVADQTNLLSINAAIEAEKAGELGRGFLVVAREIRRLADQTAVATLEIDRIVKEMQQSVTAGVMEMDKFNEQVRRGVEEVGHIENTLGEVISSVQQLLPRFQQVAEGMSAQSQGAEQIREAMAHVSEGASRTSESIREFHQATEQLRESIGKLQTDVAKFKT